MPHTIELVDVLPGALASRVQFVSPGRYIVVADSGTGKSSLLNFIYGVRHDYRGTILFDGEDIRRFDQRRWATVRRQHLAILPQELRLFPELTALENIQIKNRLTGYKTIGQIDEMLQRLDIADKRDTPVARMSIGQQQRVAVIRALCQPFDFLLLDEPVSHLDSRNNGIVADLVTSEADSRGAAIIATSVGNHIALDNPITLSL